MTNTKAYNAGYEATANAKNPYSFNSGRKSFTAWKAGHDKRWDETLPNILAWLDAQ